jgi:hypothetical protein
MSIERKPRHSIFHKMHVDPEHGPTSLAYDNDCERCRLDRIEEVKQ